VKSCSFRIFAVGFSLLWGRIGFDSIGYGWCKHAVRWIIST